MDYWQIYLAGLISISFFALAGWLLSLVRNNVAHAESMWSLFVGMSAYTYALCFYSFNPRTLLVLILITIWAIRLSAYLTWRNWTPLENHLHARIRRSHQPYFWFTSIYLVFGLQAILAWIISLPLFGAMPLENPLALLDFLGASIVIFGLSFEFIADWQRTFLRGKISKNTLSRRGLWQYFRHPNYIGEFFVWWGFYCIALSTNAWWSIISPILMTIILFKVSRNASRREI